MNYDLSHVALALPSGTGTGWATCGNELTSRLKSMGADSRVSVPHDIGARQGFTRIPGTLLSAVGNHEFQYSTTAIGDENYGYGFIENDILAEKFFPLGNRLWDGIISGSTWMEERMSGIFGVDEDETVVIQGVDTSIFKYLPVGQDQDYFVVGSFGKFEYRKSQDVVIRAMSLFMAKHKDVKLVTCWHNPWPDLIRQMNSWGDAMVNIEAIPDARMQNINSIQLAASKAGLDMDRWLEIGPCTHHILATYYRYCDVALFPNRCEAGTLLPFHEALACGLPCIAADATGMKDLTRHPEYPCGELTLRGGTPYVAKQGDVEVGNWHKVCMEEVLSQLEFAYQKRDDLRMSRKSISEFGSQFTWEASGYKMASILV